MYLCSCQPLRKPYHNQFAAHAGAGYESAGTGSSSRTPPAARYASVSATSPTAAAYGFGQVAPGHGAAGTLAYRLSGGRASGPGGGAAAAAAGFGGMVLVGGQLYALGGGAGVGGGGGIGIGINLQAAADAVLTASRARRSSTGGGAGAGGSPGPNSYSLGSFAGGATAGAAGAAGGGVLGTPPRPSGGSAQGPTLAEAAAAAATYASLGIGQPPLLMVRPKHTTDSQRSLALRLDTVTFGALAFPSLSVMAWPAGRVIVLLASRTLTAQPDADVRLPKPADVQEFDRPFDAITPPCALPCRRRCRGHPAFRLPRTTSFAAPLAAAAVVSAAAAALAHLDLRTFPSAAALLTWRRPPACPRLGLHRRHSRSRRCRRCCRRARARPEAALALVAA